MLNQFFLLIYISINIILLLIIFYSLLNNHRLLDKNFVSDLGSKRSRVHVIFNIFMTILGLISLVLPYNFQRIQSNYYFVQPLVIMSLACMLVGLITINKFIVHTIIAFTFFLASFVFTVQLLIFNVNIKFFNNYIDVITVLYLIAVTALLLKAMIPILKYKLTKRNFKKYNAGIVEWVVFIISMSWNILISYELIKLTLI